MSTETPQRKDMNEWWSDAFFGFGAYRMLAAVIAASGVFGLHYFGGKELFGDIADYFGIQDSTDVDLSGETRIIPAHEVARDRVFYISKTALFLFIGALLSFRARKSEQSDESQKN